MNPRVMRKPLPIFCIVAGVLGSLVAREVAAAVPPSVLHETGPLTRIDVDSSAAQRAVPEASKIGILVAGGSGRGFGHHSFGHFRGFGPFLGGYGIGYGVYAPHPTYEEYVAPAVPRAPKKIKRPAATESQKHVARKKTAVKPTPRLTRAIQPVPPLAEVDPSGFGAVPIMARGGGGPAPLGDTTGGGSPTLRSVRPSTDKGGLGDSTGGGRLIPFRAGQSRGRR